MGIKIPVPEEYPRRSSICPANVGLPITHPKPTSRKTETIANLKPANDYESVDMVGTHLFGNLIQVLPRQGAEDRQTKR